MDVSLGAVAVCAAACVGLSFFVAVVCVGSLHFFSWLGRAERWLNKKVERYGD